MIVHEYMDRPRSVMKPQDGFKVAVGSNPGILKENSQVRCIDKLNPCEGLQILAGDSNEAKLDRH